MKRISEEYIAKPNEELRFEKSQQPGGVIIACRGALTLINHERLNELEAQIAASAPAKIVLDLRDVSFVDSSGLGTLASALKKTMELGSELALVANDTVKKTIATAGLEKIFRCYDSPADAFRSS
jgi:anti-sigma B factor antagonist